MSNFGGDQAVSSSNPIFEVDAGGSCHSLDAFIIIIFLEERGREEVGEGRGVKKPCCYFRRIFESRFSARI